MLELLDFRKKYIVITSIRAPQLTVSLFQTNEQHCLVIFRFRFWRHSESLMLKFFSEEREYSYEPKLVVPQYSRSVNSVRGNVGVSSSPRVLVLVLAFLAIHATPATPSQLHQSSGGARVRPETGNRGPRSGGSRRCADLGEDTSPALARDLSHARWSSSASEFNS